MGKFVMKPTASGGFKFDLKAGNGEIIATSQVYKGKRGALAGAASVAKHAPAGAVENQTVEGFAKEKCPQFEVYADKGGAFRFRLKATNGQVIATSEGYTSMASCENGIESVRKNAADAEIVVEE